MLPWLLVALLGLSVAEVAAHVRIRSAVPAAADHRAAADFVRAGFRPSEAIVAAPDWHDPVVRRQLGDLIGFAAAGRSDLSRFDGLWVVAIRGARAWDEPDAAPDQQREFGGVTVRHYPLTPAPITHDFVATAHDAKVELDQGGDRPPRPCRTVDGRPGPGGGLGKAVIAPARRAVCHDKKKQAFVAPLVMEDLELRPRHCIWQPALGPRPLRVTFDDVPLGQRMVLHGGLYYEHERMREGPPVHVRVLVDGKPRGRMIHEDGDGWVRVEFPTGGRGTGGRGQVSVEVSSKTGRRRGFCWEATTRADAGGAK